MELHILAIMPFFGCGILENVTIADSVVEVGRKLFEECTSLEACNIIEKS